MIIPDYVDGIPTEKRRSAERRKLIENYYSELWKQLQRKGKDNTVFNEYLGVRVLIKAGESDKKTINRASADWRSTFAVKHLSQVITLAHGLEDCPVYFTPKNGTQKKNGYKNMAVLYYTFDNKEVDYMNFTVKLTIGIKSDNKHVQYCVNKIEIKRKSIVSSDYLT